MNTSIIRLRVPDTLTIQQLLQLVETLSEATHEDPHALAVFQNDMGQTLVPTFIGTIP